MEFTEEVGLEHSTAGLGVDLMYSLIVTSHWNYLPAKQDARTMKTA